MALNFQPYQDRAGEETRGRWSKSLDDIFNTYQAAKQNALTERDRQGQALLQHGVDPRQVTPQAMQTPEIVSGLTQFLERKRQAQSMQSREGEAKIYRETESGRLAGANADAMNRFGLGGGPGAGGPEIVTKDGQQFIVNRDAKGNPRYSANTGSQIQSEVGTKIGLAQDGLENLEYIEKILRSPKGRELALKAGGSLQKLKSLGDPEAEILANAIFQAGDSEARVKTGAAINTQEVEDYFKALVNPVGTMEGNLDRIGRKKSYFNGQMAIYGQGRNIPKRERGVEADTGGDMVRVVSPDGKSGMIPRSNLSKAVQRGFKEAR